MKIKPTETLLHYLLAGALFLLALPAQSAEVSAKLDWAELHYASVPVNGFVERVLVQPGQRVSKGDKLLSLDSTVLTARLQQARARVGAARPVMTDAQREYRDAQALYEQTVLSDVELKRAKMSFDIAKAKLDEAEAMASEASARLARASQYAPWDAWVIERNVESGQVIIDDLRTQPLIVLARADARVAVAQVSVENLGQLKIGQAIKLRYREQTYAGSVQSLALRASDTPDRTFTLKVVFPVEPDRFYPPGDSATLILP